MIFGEYPCCNGSLFLHMPGRTPAYAPEDCPHCGARVWHEYLRAGPCSYVEADFLARFDVNDTTMQVIPKAAA